MGQRRMKRQKARRRADRGRWQRRYRDAEGEVRVDRIKWSLSATPRPRRIAGRRSS